MPRTKNATHRKNATPPSPATANAEEPPEVLTLTEAAAYLRVTEADLLRNMVNQSLPGRLVGNEWRFLKSALQDWLRTPAPVPSKDAMAACIGAWKDDPHWEEMLQEIYKRRGRPMTEDGE